MRTRDDYASICFSGAREGPATVAVTGWHAALVETWRRRGAVSYLLWPLAMLYRAVVAARRTAYRLGWLPVHRFEVPVVVVGNLTVGGSGKTPVVAAIAGFLRLRGYKPGIVSRGYGGRARQWPQAVAPDSAPDLVGDEPVLLARRTGCPVVVGPNRSEAVRRLLEDNDCDVVVSDDGLQHLALHRDVEIVVVDGERGFGNGLCLPAGPLREPESRLRSVDLVVYNGDGAAGARCRLVGDTAVNLRDPSETKPLHEFRGRAVHAVAGIGNPSRFFTYLRDAGLQPNEHRFPDHHAYTASDLAMRDGAPILMTEKDAVKCTAFATEAMWYVPVEAQLDDRFYEQLTDLLKRHDR